MDITIISKDSFTFVGLSTVCPMSELGIEVPKLWKQLERRKDEILYRTDMNYRVELFLGRNGDIFTEAVGFVVKENSPVPEGMIKVSVPSYRYAVISHRGPDVQQSYLKVFQWMKENGYEVAPYQEAFHHIEWYPEHTFQPSGDQKGLEYEIYARLLE
mgnify:CR=1 FL=1